MDFIPFNLFTRTLSVSRISQRRVVLQARLFRKTLLKERRQASKKVPTGPRKKQKYFCNPLKRASSKERARIWSDIYANYKKHYFNSDRTLTQLKKRQQNLEYEFKSLKQRSQNTGEEGFKKVKEGFPSYDYFDKIMDQVTASTHRKCKLKAPRSLVDS